jgi:hypothetical protein
MYEENKMNFLNHIANKMAANKLKHERTLAALHASIGELSGVYSCEDAASQCFYSSLDINL